MAKGNAKYNIILFGFCLTSSIGRFLTNAPVPLPFIYVTLFQLRGWFDNNWPERQSVMIVDPELPFIVSLVSCKPVGPGIEKKNIKSPTPELLLSSSPPVFFSALSFLISSHAVRVFPVLRESFYRPFPHVHDQLPTPISTTLFP